MFSADVNQNDYIELVAISAAREILLPENILHIYNPTIQTCIDLQMQKKNGGRLTRLHKKQDPVWWEKNSGGSKGGSTAFATEIVLLPLVDG